jgi:predicted nuclease of predicted toxin-antitoxin system
VKLLLDEMYPAALAEALRQKGVDTATVAALGLAGRSDLDTFAAAVADGYAVVTENVADFARIAGEHVAAGRPHPGVLVALSSRFSRRPAGRVKLVAAIVVQLGDLLDDRVIYLSASFPQP